jgi:hypothetical protein
VACGGQIGPYQAKATVEPATDEPAPSVIATERQMTGARERARLYRELVSFITEGRGWVVSEPGRTPLRFEAVDSSLADQLRDAGHRVTNIGRAKG